MHRRYEPTNIPIEVLRSFITILELGSFTKAAERLNITQPAISAQMKRMQSLVGEVLFRKDGVGITLTEKGETVSRYARRIIALNDQIMLSGRCEKKMRIGLPSVMGGQYLGVLKDTLSADGFHSVQIVCDRSDLLLKRISAGFFDVALAFTASSAEDSTPAIEWAEPLAWVCHPEFVLSVGAPLPLLSWPNSVTDQIAVKACEQAQIGYTAAFVGDQLAAHLEALRHRLGYFCVPERCVPPGMKVAKDYFLPKLPPMHAGIYKNRDIPDARRIDGLARGVAKVFQPTQSEKRDVCDTVASTQPCQFEREQRAPGSKPSRESAADQTNGQRIRDRADGFRQ